MIRLAPFCAQQKREIYDALRAGSPPPFGTYDEAVWRAAKAKAEPQMGTTVFAPDRLTYEFIYPAPEGAIVLAVIVEPPERIIYLPVPAWVVENIWQGEVSGSFAFANEAQEHISAFQVQITPEGNRPLFDRPMPKGKD